MCTNTNTHAHHILIHLYNTNNPKTTMKKSIKSFYVIQMWLNVRFFYSAFLNWFNYVNKVKFTAYTTNNTHTDYVENLARDTVHTVRTGEAC